jgi:flagella basal body P-ring formation protein FlgA
MTTTTNPNGATTAGVAPSRAEAAVRVAPAPKLRRRPALIAASVAAICLGGLLAAFAWTATSNTQSVLAMRVAVERGAVIGPDDVMTVQVSTDPALRPVPASQASTVVGQRAATDIAAGTLVTRSRSATRSCPRGACRSWGWDCRRPRCPENPFW